MSELTKVADVPVGYLFRKPDNVGHTSLWQQDVFIKLMTVGDGHGHNLFNVVNVANKCVAYVDPLEDVVVLGNPMDNSIKDLLARDSKRQR